MEEERAKDAALYTSLQRFRVRDIREEVDGSFSYVLIRSGYFLIISLTPLTIQPTHSPQIRSQAYGCDDLD